MSVIWTPWRLLTIFYHNLKNIDLIPVKFLSVSFIYRDRLKNVFTFTIKFHHFGWLWVYFVENDSHINDFSEEIVLNAQKVYVFTHETMFFEFLA